MTIIRAWVRGAPSGTSSINRRTAERLSGRSSPSWRAADSALVSSVFSGAHAVAWPAGSVIARARAWSISNACSIDWNSISWPGRSALIRLMICRARASARSWCPAALRAFSDHAADADCCYEEGFETLAIFFVVSVFVLPVLILPVPVLLRDLASARDGQRRSRRPRRRRAPARRPRSRAARRAGLPPAGLPWPRSLSPDRRRPTPKDRRRCWRAWQGRAAGHLRARCRPSPRPPRPRPGSGLEDSRPGAAVMRETSAGPSRPATGDRASSARAAAMVCRAPA